MEKCYKLDYLYYALGLLNMKRLDVKAPEKVTGRAEIRPAVAKVAVAQVAVKR